MRLFARPPTLVLMVGDDGVVAVPFHLPEAAPFFAAGDDRDSQREIATLATAYPHTRIIIVADNLAQDYRTDRLPRLLPWDRARLLRRRLRAAFPHAGLRSARRQKGGAFLLAALHEGNPVLHWAERLQRHRPRIALAPVESTGLLQRLRPDSAKGWAMLIARQRSGGYRQIVTRDGALAFTRLTPLATADEVSEADAIARDIKASLDYLARHGLTDPGELDLIVLSGFAHRDGPLDRLELKSLTVLSPHHIARQQNLALAPAEDDPHSDLLFAAAIAERRPMHSMRLPAAARQHRIAMIRRAGTITAGLLLCGALAASLWQTRNLFALWTQANDAAARRDVAQSELSSLQASAAPVTAPLGRIRQALERQRIYAADSVLPWHALNELAATDGLPRLARFDWRAPDDGPEALTVKWQVARDSDRAAAVDAFADTSRRIAQAMPDYDVTASEPPYPSLPNDAVSAGNTTQADAFGSISLARRAP